MVTVLPLLPLSCIVQLRNLHQYTTLQSFSLIAYHWLLLPVCSYFSASIEVTAGSVGWQEVDIHHGAAQMRES